MSASTMYCNIIIHENYEEYLKWLETFVEKGHCSEIEETKLVIKYLKSGKLNEHIGRYLIVSKTHIYPESFLNISDSFNIGIGKEYGIAYTLPELYECSKEVKDLKRRKFIHGIEYENLNHRIYNYLFG